MTILTHALIGAGLASTQSNIPAGVTVGFCSHFLLDLIPHNDYIYLLFRFDRKSGINKSLVSKIVLAATLISVIALFFTSGKNPQILAGSIGGMLPDFITALTAEFKLGPTFLDHWHHHLHSHANLPETLMNIRRPGTLVKSHSLDGYVRNFGLITRDRLGKAGLLLESAAELCLIIAALWFFLNK